MRAIFPAVIALAVAALSWFLINLYKRCRFVRGLPGPPHHPIWGHLLVGAEMCKHIPRDCHPHLMSNWLSKTYGLEKAFYFDVWPMGPQTLFVIDPDMANQATTTLSLLKSPLVKVYLERLLGSDNMVTLEGSKWKTLRSLFNPGFSTSHLMTLVPSVVDDVIYFNEVLERKANEGTVFQLEEYATRLTIDIIGRITLGVEFNSQCTENRIVTAFRKQVSMMPPGRSINPFEGFSLTRPLKLWWNGRKLTQYLGEYLDEKYASRRRSKTTGPEKKTKAVIDLALDMYEKEYQSSKDKGKGLDPSFKQTAIDQIKTFIFAGHDTTSSTIAYILYFLHLYPHIQARLTAELNNVFGKEPANAARLLRSDPHLLNQLPYNTAVLKETLRLFPPASTVRKGDGRAIVDPSPSPSSPTHYPIPSTIQVWPVAHGIHRYPPSFPKPSSFIPERWLPAESPFPPPHRDAWRPFEKGPRHCIGENLALLETKIIMVLVMRSFEFTPELTPFCEPEELENGGDLKVGGPDARVKSWEGHQVYQILAGSAKPKGGMRGSIRVRDGY